MNRITALYIIAVILLLSACLYTYKAENTTTHTRTADQFSQANLETKNGAVTITATTDTLATVKITCYAYGKNKDDAQKRLEKITVTDMVNNNLWDLRVNFPPSGVPQGAIIDAYLPASTRTTIATSNNKVTVSGITGSISVTTSNSPVTLIGTAGTASIATRNSPVTVQVHSGAITITTTSGAIDCDLAELPPTASATLTTTSAKIILRLPPDLSAYINAAATNGTVVITGYNVHYEEQTRERIRARIGSGASAITITTTKGDIVIQNRQATGNGQKNTKP